MLYFFHTQYLLPSAGEVSQEAFQMSHRFLILLFLDDCGKQKITALQSLNIYFYHLILYHYKPLCFAGELLESLVHTEG